MDILSDAVFGSVFAVVVLSVFTGLIWAAFSDGGGEQPIRARMARGNPPAYTAPLNTTEGGGRL